MLSVDYTYSSTCESADLCLYFKAFDGRTTSARELLRQVQAQRFKQANPKLKIGIDVHNRPDSPVASFKYVDGSEVSTIVARRVAIEFSIFVQDSHGSTSTMSNLC